MALVDVIIDTKLMFIFGIIGIILFRLFFKGINIADSITIPIALFTMFSFMASILLVVMGGYKS